MTFYPIIMPPGLYRAGTEYKSKGRWYDCNLVRFYAGTIQPEGGWRVKSTSMITGVGRAILTWRDNSTNTWTAVGTESNLYAMTRSGVVHDITPAGFTPGRADAVAEGGYGSGLYGVGTYGSPRADSSTIQEASMWSLDTFGEDLNAVMAEDGIIYEWLLNTAVIAAPVANAPTAESLFVTQEGMLMALAAAGVPRRAQWSDQRDNTVWTPSATNQAGDFDLQTNGTLLQGLRITGGFLLLTDLDCWLGNYTADTLVYGFNKKGEGCGTISRGAAIDLDSQAVWMGKTGFWLYNGYVEPLPCDVWDYVFGNINTQQVSKVTCELNAAFGEITWHYPSANSVEIDSSVTWNYRENHWRVGSTVRLSGIDAGVTTYPQRVALDGNVYEHEVGYSYSGELPFLEGGPMEIGLGDNVMYANLLMPDSNTLGDMTATFFTRFEPDGPEYTFGPFTLNKRTDLRVTNGFCGREMRPRFDGVTNTSWRIGLPRIDISEGSGR